MVQPGFYSNHDGTVTITVYDPGESGEDGWDIVVKEDNEEWMAFFSTSEAREFISENELVWKRELNEYERDL